MTRGLNWFTKMAAAALALCATLAVNERVAKARDIGWAVSGDFLYSIADTGAPTLVSSGWTGATSMGSGPSSNTLYIVQNSRFWSVHYDGTGRTQLGNPEWGGATEMVQCFYSAAVYPTEQPFTADR